MRRSLRRHLAKGKMVSGDSRDQNYCGGAMGRTRGIVVPPSQNGYGCFLGFATAFSLMGSGGAATFVGADIVEGGRGRGPMKSGRNKLKYHRAYPTQRGRTLFPLNLNAGAYMARPSVPSHHFTSMSTPHTRFISLARIPRSQSPNILCAHISQMLTIPYRLTFVWTWTRHHVPVNIEFEHHSRINFGGIVVCGVSNVVV